MARQQETTESDTLEEMVSPSTAVESAAVPQPIRQGDELYVVGDQVREPRRLTGSPSVLASPKYRMLDVQLALTTLKKKMPTPITQPKTTSKPIVEKVRPTAPTADEGNIDDILKDYVAKVPTDDAESVDQILQGYLGDESASSAQKTDQDLETLLMDYAEEDTKGSS